MKIILPILIAVFILFGIANAAATININPGTITPTQSSTITGSCSIVGSTCNLIDLATGATVATGVGGPTSSLSYTTIPGTLTPGAYQFEVDEVGYGSISETLTVAAAPYVSTYCNPGGVVETITPWYCSQINQAAASVWSRWSGIAVAVIFVSFGIAGLLFMIGVLLHNEKIRTFGIGEMYEALATTFIVVFFLFISAIMFGLIPGITTGPIDPYNTSLVYINQTISTSQGLVGQLFNTSVVDSYYTSIQLNVCIANDCTPIIPGILYFSIYYLYIIPATRISSLILDGLLVLHTEFYLILFLMYASIPVFLIPGIIFRAFLPTRAIGGMLIAIAISFYLIMPTLFSIAFYQTHAGLLSELASDSAQIYQLGQGTGSQANADTPGAPLIVALNGVQTAMGDFWVTILFYPGLILAITYAAISTIAQFIGGMAQTSSKLRLF